MRFECIMQYMIYSILTHWRCQRLAENSLDVIYRAIDLGLAVRVALVFNLCALLSNTISSLDNSSLCFME